MSAETVLTHDTDITDVHVETGVHIDDDHIGNITVGRGIETQEVIYKNDVEDINDCLAVLVTTSQAVQKINNTDANVSNNEETWNEGHNEDMTNRVKFNADGTYEDEKGDEINADNDDTGDDVDAANDGDVDDVDDAQKNGSCGEDANSDKANNNKSVLRCQDYHTAGINPHKDAVATKQPATNTNKASENTTTDAECTT